MFVRRILVCALFGSFVLAAPPHPKTGAVNDNQEVRSIQNQPPVPSGNFSVARNSNLTTFSIRPLLCDAAHLERKFALVNIYNTGPYYDVRGAVGCINQLRMFASSDSCSKKDNVAVFGGCSCISRFGYKVDNKGNSAGEDHWFTLVKRQIRSTKFRGALVAEIDVGHPDKMLGTAVDCSGKNEGVANLVDRWSGGAWAENPADEDSFGVSVAYNY
ncbi:MAG: hypothetical protein J3Q66DRAFT_386747 [Benniella sp.]|nr:MAG: hypothetical protein J3Q66DRAFT_386747 [Benniella sp.]